MDRPFFSVIIPTFNRQPWIQTAVRSVLSQTCPHFELIVIDDGSTDGTGEWLGGLEDKRVRVIRQENRGVAGARNRGLDAARADWMAFLDSDDRWLEPKLRRTLEEVRRCPETKIFHTEELWFKGDRRVYPKEKHRKPQGWVYRRALRLCCISISTAVVHRRVFDEVGGFDESLPACEDYDFWLRATSRFPVRLIPEALTLKDGGRPDQLSAGWGLDRYRIRALAKMIDSGGLSGGERQRTRDELRLKLDVYLRGARKRGKAGEVRVYERMLEKFDEDGSGPLGAGTRNRERREETCEARDSMN